ncbi:MAG: hypothetical protein VKJ24_20725 [Synechococcales bacterium]|nr:hypothetical protein [Synechococcales bacterium]
MQNIRQHLRSHWSYFGKSRTFFRSLGYPFAPIALQHQSGRSQ